MHVNTELHYNSETDMANPKEVPWNATLPEANPQDFCFSDLHHKKNKTSRL